MYCGSSWSQNPAPTALLTNASPAVYNSKDKSISFMPRWMTRNEFNMNLNLNSQNHQMINNECITISAARNVPGSQFGIQGTHPLTNQLFVNGPNTSQNSNLSLQKRTIGNVNINKCFHPSTDQLPVNRSNMAQHPYLQHHHLFSERSQMIQSFRPATDQLSANEPSVHQQSYSLVHQLPSNGIGLNQNSMIQDFRPVPVQLSENESNVHQQSYSLVHQLPSNGIGLNQNSKMSIQQQSFRSASSDESCIISPGKHPPTYASCKSELGRNKIKYPPGHQQSERHSIMRQGLHSIFGGHSTDRLDTVQHRNISGQSSEGNQSLHPLPSDILETEVKINLESLVSNTLLHQNLYPQYVEEVTICVVGPPRCGKADLIRTFARNDDIRIPTDEPLSLVLQQGMSSFGTILKINIWHGEDLISAAVNLKSQCESSKSVILLVYSVARKSTLLTAVEWIQVLKESVDSNVPINLIGNTTDVDSCLSTEYSEVMSNLVKFSEGIGAKENYDFELCSTKRVKDVEEVFLLAAHKAIYRTI